MRKSALLLLALALLGAGSCASARTYYEENTVYDPYYGPMTEVNAYRVHPRTYYYYDDHPSVAGFVNRSAKTSVGLPAKAAKEAFKAVF
jgi:hypothetical protein